jgi:hypothetical protein
MRKAFGQGGPLEDETEAQSERESLCHLMAGAIGRFKNPSSHRHVGLARPAEVFQLLVIASHLLDIVEFRYRAQLTQQTPGAGAPPEEPAA